MSASLASNKPKTLNEVKQWFFREGLPVTEWAKAHGFRPEAVYALLAGRTVGRRGQAHRAAIALGLKLGSSDSALALSPTADNSTQGESTMR
jgi:gp16 family phage-associated protein